MGPGRPNLPRIARELEVRRLPEGHRAHAVEMFLERLLPIRERLRFRDRRRHRREPAGSVRVLLEFGRIAVKDRRAVPRIRRRLVGHGRPELHFFPGVDAVLRVDVVDSRGTEDRRSVLEPAVAG